MASGAFYENPSIVGSSIQAPRSRIALALTKGLAIQDALDLGCGDGEVTAELGRITGATAVGADVSAVAVEACRRRGLRAQQLVPGAGLPFEHQSFDLVFMTEVIEHLLDPARTLKE